jgi:cytidyltransferase-like protein
MKIVLVTGGFDPLHSGHIAYFKAARTLGDMLIVGLNSDEWLTRKKGRPFMPWTERLCVINNLAMVNEVYTFDDADGSAKEFIRQVRAHYPDATLVFANGGDRTKTNIPEMDVLEEMLHLEFVFGVGGEHKMNSSSWILQEWKAPKTERQWGYYRVLHEVPGMKVKELTVDPGKSLSMQRHQLRAEYWMVSEGECVVNSMMPNGYVLPSKHLTKHQEFKIPVTDWHQLTNPFDVPCKIVEIQYGENCIEEDIERK